MERESFEDREVAEMMNRTFVSIKVDREERPDIDSVYMTVCQLMTGQGGWPLTIIMTPDKLPFFAATYIPRKARFGRPGMPELISSVGEVWRERRREIGKSGTRVLDALTELSGPKPAEDIGRSVLEAGRRNLEAVYDPEHGGFGSAPKFPSAHNLLFLLGRWRRTGHEGTLDMVVNTLRAMRRGGIYDHVGYGFHRYSTDAGWFVPHFEKMLYDQAMLGLAYTAGFQATGEELFGRTVSEVLEYVRRDLTSPEGAFYSAEDADSEGEEGKFYVWEERRIREVLDSSEADLVIGAFGVRPEGNFQDEATGTRPGTNILHLTSRGESPGRSGVAASAICKLFEAREKRPRPARDDKILTDWNGLMIAAMARAGAALESYDYVLGAGRAADFILARMRTPEGLLLHRHHSGESGIDGNLSDYAYLVWGLIELYMSSLDTRRLEVAVELNRVMLERFWDRSAGALFFTAEDAGELPVRKKEIYDGAVPSGNAVALHNLLRLARLTGDASVEERAWELARALAGSVKENPTGHVHLLAGLDLALGPTSEIVIAGRRPADCEGMIRALHRAFLPHAVWLCKTGNDRALSSLAPFTRDLEAADTGSLAYVCRNNSCEFPISRTGDMIERLEGDALEAEDE
jgi:hypothetical protein